MITLKGFTKRLNLYLPVFILVVLAGIFSSSVSAYDLKTSSFSQDLTGFRWCFTGLEGFQDSSDYMLSINKVSGCQDVNSELVVIVPSSRTVKDCRAELDCNKVQRQQVSNVTGKIENITVDECVTRQVCIDRQESFLAEVPFKKAGLADSSVFAAKDTVFCLKGSRKAITGAQKCDMNFKDLKSGTDTALQGFAWWTLSWQTKYHFNTSNTTIIPIKPLRIILNSSNFNLTDCQPDAGDLRVVNEDENLTLQYNVSLVNSSQITVYVNATEGASGYIYCNSTTVVNTTGNFFFEPQLLTGLKGGFKLNGNAQDTEGLTTGAFINGTGTSWSTNPGALNGWVNFTTNDKYNRVCLGRQEWLESTTAFTIRA